MQIRLHYFFYDVNVYNCVLEHLANLFVEIAFIFVCKIGNDYIGYGNIGLYYYCSVFDWSFDCRSFLLKKE